MKQNLSLEETIKIETARLIRKGYKAKRIQSYLSRKYGLSPDIAKHFLAKTKEGFVRENPPPGAVEIYDKILAIEAVKGKNSLWPGEKFRHDFKQYKTAAKIYGLPDGSLLIKSVKGKRLWKNFEY